MVAGCFVESGGRLAGAEDFVDFARADVRAEFVVFSAVEVDALRGREGIGAAADEGERIEVEPALPGIRAPAAGVVVEPLEAAGLAGGGRVVGAQAP